MAGEVLVDALPYIDQGYDDPGVREAVSTMIILLFISWISEVWASPTINRENSSTCTALAGRL